MRKPYPLLIPLLMIACNGSGKGDDTGQTSTTVDGGTTDGGTTDGGESDGGTTDGGTADGGTADGGTADGGTADGGTTDGGSTDGGATDGGTTGAFAITDLSWRLDADIGTLAFASWNQNADATVHVEYSFDDGEWLQSPSMDATSGTHEQLLVGIPFGMDVSWAVVAETEDLTVSGDTITTDDAPRGLPLGTVEVSEEASWLPEGKYLLTSINQQTGGWTGGHYWTMIIDRQARPVWAQVAPSGHWSLFVQVAQAGDHILWDESTYWSDWDDGAGSVVHRTYLDQEIDVISTPGLHHEFVQLPDETLVWGSQDHGGREALVEQPMGSTDQTIIWTCQADWPGSGDCESNGLFYSESTDTYLYSFYTNNSLVEVDRATGESLWWAGDLRNGYSFADGSRQFSWQHGISYTDTGTLLLSTYATEAGHSITPAIEYEVDHDTETLTEVWSYNPGVEAGTNGDTWRLDNGNTLHTVGSAGYVNEVNPDGDLVWSVNYGGTHLMGRSELIEDLYTLVSPDSAY